MNCDQFCDDAFTAKLNSVSLDAAMSTLVNSWKYCAPVASPTLSALGTASTPVSVATTVDDMPLTSVLVFLQLTRITARI